MTDKRVLYKDKDRGVSVVHEYDHTNDTQTVHEYQDVSAILEQAAAERQYSDETFHRGVKGSWWKVATIPVGLQSKWLKEFCDLTGRINVPLSDPEYQDFESKKIRSREFRKFCYTDRRF